MAGTNLYECASCHDKIEPRDVVFQKREREDGSGETFNIVLCPDCAAGKRTSEPVEPAAISPAADVHTFASGAQSSGKLPDYHLVPLLTLLDRLAPRFSLGVSKGYGVDGWRKGLGDPAWILDRANHGLAHFARVVAKVKNGIPTDHADDDLAGALWSLVVIAESELVHATGEILTAHAAIDKAADILRESVGTDRRYKATSPDGQAALTGDLPEQYLRERLARLEDERAGTNG